MLVDNAGDRAADGLARLGRPLLPSACPGPFGRRLAFGAGFCFAFGPGFCFIFSSGAVCAWRTELFSRARSSRSAMRRSAIFVSSSAIFVWICSTAVGMMPFLMLIGRRQAFSSVGLRWPILEITKWRAPYPDQLSSAPGRRSSSSDSINSHEFLFESTVHSKSPRSFSQQGSKGREKSAARSRGSLNGLTQIAVEGLSAKAMGPDFDRMAGCNGGEVREARCRFPRPRPAIQLAPRETGARQRLERRLRRTVEHVLWSCLSALSAHWASIGFPLRRHSGFVAALFEPKDNAGGAAARADSTSTRSGHHVMAAAVVPAHQIGLDGPLTEHHRHRILNVSRRDIAMRVHLRQGLDQSFFQGVFHCRLNMIAHGTLGKGSGLSSTGVNEHPERPPTGLPRASRASDASPPLQPR